MQNIDACTAVHFLTQVFVGTLSGVLGSGEKGHLDKMPVKSAITVTIESCLKEEKRSSNRKHRVPPPPPPPNYPDYDVIRKQVGEGREIDNIRGDGNFFFRAVSKVIRGSEENLKQLRDLHVEFLNAPNKNILK